MKSKNAILVVDDDEFQRELIGMQLGQIGNLAVLYADSGQAALKVLERHQAEIRMVITDLSMPDMDGLELMRHMAHREERAPVALVSGVPDAIMKSAANLAQAHGLRLLGVLPKPSTIDALQALMAELQRYEHSHRAAGGGVAAAPVDLSADRLRQALAQGEVLPWYQPKLDVATGRVAGLEALARWPQPSGGFISPGVFVPAIEDAGLADELFFAMATAVLQDMNRWRSAGVATKVAINLSMESALNLDLPDRLQQLLEQHQVPPSELTIEVTESRLMVERSVALESLTRLSLLGFGLSIDDFGTGYSSLVQLVDLPFTELKIDGSFVQRADQDAKAETVLRVATLLGQHLDMQVVAEGVETPDQYERLRQYGCNVVQGYHFGRPMPFEKCSTWLAQQR